ncbi:hypothetical protein [Pseudogemmobacter humi]|uniref:hypothetical protein n=1 Tax=Pseudogemmobacter humi TaxID=2483812 RepID=UPI000F545E56|nr:hypothetical protein [Pseudogemmobacter humi]
MAVNGRGAFSAFLKLPFFQPDGVILLQKKLDRVAWRALPEGKKVFNSENQRMGPAQTAHGKIGFKGGMRNV